MPKKVNISAENYVIDFKQVILGEFQERSLILRNDGALESDFRILDRNGDIIPSISEN